TPDCDELSLSEPMSSEDIDAGVRENVRRKYEAVSDRLSEDTVVICADTAVVVRESSTAVRCLGKPPVDGWPQTVAEWFAAYYSQGAHWVRTCFAVTASDCSAVEVVETEVKFRPDACELVPWYLSTKESIGKAGGYGLQGAGSVFASEVRGSLSNVIGLPLERVLPALQSVGVV
ncbi:MAG: Maf family protein, partial [Planctomycetaceae bacterium]